MGDARAASSQSHRTRHALPLAHGSAARSAVLKKEVTQPLTAGTRPNETTQTLFERREKWSRCLRRVTIYMKAV